jgi:hypothetical protein
MFEFQVSVAMVLNNFVTCMPSRQVSQRSGFDERSVCAAIRKTFAALNVTYCYEKHNFYLVLESALPLLCGACPKHHS